MVFWTSSWLGVRWFVWIFFFTAIALGMGVILYFFREKLREKYLKIRFPEKVIRCVMHYPGSPFFQEYWRLIPDQDNFQIGKKIYLFNDEALLKKNDAWALKDNEKFKITIDGKEYNLDFKFKIKRRWDRFPEIHYVFGVPSPIDFTQIDKGEIKFTSNDLKSFKENDLFQKLLTLQGEKNMIMFCIILGAINLMATLFILAKLMGWIK